MEIEFVRCPVCSGRGLVAVTDKRVKAYCKCAVCESTGKVLPEVAQEYKTYRCIIN